MKATSKIVSVLALLSLLIGIFSVSVFAEGEKNYLVIGDSIAYSYGISNPKEAAYGKIVADTNGYSFKNNGFPDGETTETLYYKVHELESYRRDIADADIISISIGGNDYFLTNTYIFHNQYDELRIFYGAIEPQWILVNLINCNIKKDFSALDSIAVKSAKYFSMLIDEIKSINPDAVILVQTLYTSWQSRLGKPLFGGVADRVNQMISGYLSEHPGSIEIVDVAAAFEGKKGYTTADTIHPSAAGNLAIAQATLDKLCDLGLGSSREPVITAPAQDYNLFVEDFGYIPGKLLTFLIKILTRA